MIRVWRATVEWYWQGKTEELEERPVPVALCPPQIPHGLTRARTRDSAVRGRRLTPWAIRPAFRKLTRTKTMFHTQYSVRCLHLYLCYATVAGGGGLHGLIEASVPAASERTHILIVLKIDETNEPWTRSVKEACMTSKFSPLLLLPQWRKKLGNTRMA
jgi:hypothetical protein